MRVKSVFGSKRYAGNVPSAAAEVDRMDLERKRLKPNPWIVGYRRHESRNGTYHMKYHAPRGI